MLLFEKYNFCTSLSQLMLEAKIEYTDEMKDVLTRLNTNISRKLISLINQEINIDISGFDIMHRNDMVKFMRIGGRDQYYKVARENYIYGKEPKLKALAGIDPDDEVLYSLPLGTYGIIKKCWIQIHLFTHTKK